MLSKLPPWVEYWAFTLAMLAGTINAVGLLDFREQAVSHMSGIATLLATEVINSSITTFHLAAMIGSFMLGAAISGLLISNESLKMGRHYDLLLLIEGVFLVVAVYLMSEHAAYGHYLAAAACGLQNALATKYSGAVIRTTHLTGILTDLGIMLGAALRGERFDQRKFILFLTIIAGFISGGVIGSVLYGDYEYMALCFPAGVCFLLAAIYRIYRNRRQTGRL